MSVTTVSDDTVDFARQVLATSGFGDLLYARVDIVATPEGWAVMELELIEPSLFFWLVPEGATTLARALRRRLDARRSR